MMRQMSPPWVWPLSHEMEAVERALRARAGCGRQGRRRMQNRRAWWFCGRSQQHVDTCSHSLRHNGDGRMAHASKVVARPRPTTQGEPPYDIGAIRMHTIIYADCRVRRLLAWWWCRCRYRSRTGTATRPGREARTAAAQMRHAEAPTEAVSPACCWHLALAMRRRRRRPCRCPSSRMPHHIPEAGGACHGAIAVLQRGAEAKAIGACLLAASSGGERTIAGGGPEGS